MSQVIGVEFRECEHEGDLGNYISDLVAAGAKVLGGERVNEEAEVGYVRISVEDFKDFITRFKKTESYDFSNISS